MKKLIFFIFIVVIFLTGCVLNEPTPIVSQSVIKNTSEKKLINNTYRTLDVDKLISVNNPYKIIEKYIKYVKCDEYTKQPFEAIDCRLSRKTDYENINKVLKYLVSAENKIIKKKEKAYFYKRLAYLFSLLNDDYQAIYYLKKSLNIDKNLCNKMTYTLDEKDYCLNIKGLLNIYETEFPLLYDYDEIANLNNNLNEKIFYNKKIISLIDKFSPITNLKKIIKIDKERNYKYLDNRTIYFELLNKKLEKFYSLVYLYKEKKEYKKALYYLKKAYNLDLKIGKLNYYKDLHNKQKNYLTLSNLNEYKELLAHAKLNYLLTKARIYSQFDRKNAIKTFIDYYKTWKDYIILKKRNEILLVTTKYNEDIRELKKYKNEKNKKSLSYVMKLSFLGVRDPSQIDKKINELEQAKQNKLIKIEKKYSYLKDCKRDNLYYACVRDFDGLLSYLEFFKLANVINKNEYLVNLLKYIEKNRLYYRDFYMFSINYKPYLYYSFGKYFFEERNYKLAFDNLIKASKNKINKYNNFIFDGEYYYMLGVSAQKLGYYADAFAFYEKSIKDMNKDIVKLSASKQKKLIEKNKNIISYMMDTAIEAKKVYQDINGILLEKAINYSLNYKNSLFEIEDYIASLYYKTNDSELKSLIGNYFNLKRKLNENYIKNKDTKDLENQIKVIYNQILFLKPYKKEFITQKDIADKLNNHELFINIVYSNNKYYIFYFDSEDNIGWKLFNCFNSLKLNKNIKKYKKITKKLIFNPNNHKLIKIKKELVSKIFEEIFGFLRNDKNMSFDRYKKIIISPDGALRLVSFGELYNIKNKKYLIQEKEVVYVPSVKFLFEKRNSTNIKKAVIFADPIFDKKIKTIRNDNLRGINNLIQTRDILRNLKVQPLPGTLMEAKLIKYVLKKKKVNKKLYLKDKATSDNLLKVNSPTILHLATHGFFIDSDVPNPMLKSGVLLTGANKSIDGVVTALRLSGINLNNTDLVVLSACDTGVVDLSSTDNIGALNKSFLLAGADNVVSTLWSINDDKTVEFMKLFYKNYLDSHKASKALRAAQIDFINRGYTSTFWAPFIIFIKGND